jgi:hypothetical protein
MVAAFAQLHDDVLQPCLAFLLAASSVDGVNVLLEDHLVPFALKLGHTNVYIDFLLGQQALLHVHLDPTEQERS